jgi:hypothetical protein
MRLRLSGTLLLGALAAAVGLGCRSDHLVFTTYTKVGLDISTTNGQMANGMFGYKRFEGAIVPVDVDQQVTAGKSPQVASVFAGIAVENSWLDGLALAQVFGTGEAAEALAQQKANCVGRILSLVGDPGGSASAAATCTIENPAKDEREDDQQGDDE